MSDIIKVLRFYDRPLTDLAADEIEKLRAERDAAVARYRHVIEILRRDGYWAALMEDAEIDAQVDAAIDAARGEK